MGQAPPGGLPGEVFRHHVCGGGGVMARAIARENMWNVLSIRSILDVDTE